MTSQASNPSDSILTQVKMLIVLCKLPTKLSKTVCERFNKLLSETPNLLSIIKTNDPEDFAALMSFVEQNHNALLPHFKSAKKHKSHLMDPSSIKSLRDLFDREFTKVISYPEIKMSEPPQSIEDYEREHKRKPFGIIGRDRRVVPLIHACVIDNKKTDLRYILKDPKIDINAHENSLGFTPLMLAAEEENEEIIEILLTAKKHHLDINATNNQKDTALNIAAASGNLSVVTKLCAAGADLNLQNFAGYSPIFTSVARNRISILKFLLTQDNVNLNFKDINGHSMLLTAIALKHMEALSVLLDPIYKNRIDVNAKNDVGASPLYFAMVERNYDALKLLLQHPNIRLQKMPFQELKADGKEWRDGHAIKLSVVATEFVADDATELHLIQRTNDIEILDIFSTSSLWDVNATTEVGYSLLESAIFEKNKKIANRLLDDPKLNANVASANMKSKCPILHALIKTSLLYHFPKILSHPSLDINLRDNQGYTALHHATMIGNISSLTLLLKNKADTTLETCEGYTALHLAVQNNHLDAVELLIKHNPELLLIVDNENFTPLDYALDFPESSYAFLLLREAINIPEFDVNTYKVVDLPLVHFAVFNNHISLLKQLLAFPKIDINKEFNNVTPMQLAVSCGHEDIIAVLKAHQQKTTPNSTSGPSKEQKYSPKLFPPAPAVTTPSNMDSVIDHCEYSMLRLAEAKPVNDDREDSERNNLQKDKLETKGESSSATTMSSSKKQSTIEISDAEKLELADRGYFLMHDKNAIIPRFIFIEPTLIKKMSSEVWNIVKKHLSSGTSMVGKNGQGLKILKPYPVVELSLHNQDSRILGLNKLVPETLVLADGSSFPIEKFIFRRLAKKHNAINKEAELMMRSSNG